MCLLTHACVCSYMLMHAHACIWMLMDACACSCMLVYSYMDMFMKNDHKIYFFYANHPLQGFKSHCRVRGYKLLLQQKLIDPPLECCEIVICWKAFIGEGVPNGCGSRKKA